MGIQNYKDIKMRKQHTLEHKAISEIYMYALVQALQACEKWMLHNLNFMEWY